MNVQELGLRTFQIPTSQIQFGHETLMTMKPFVCLQKMFDVSNNTTESRFMEETYVRISRKHPASDVMLVETKRSTLLEADRYAQSLCVT